MPTFDRPYVNGSVASNGFAVAPERGPGFTELIASDIGKYAGDLVGEVAGGDRRASRAAVDALTRQRDALASKYGAETEGLNLKNTATKGFLEGVEATVAEVTRRIEVGEPLDPELAEAATEQVPLTMLMANWMVSGGSAKDFNEFAISQAEPFGLGDKAMTNAQLALRSLGTGDAINRDDQITLRKDARTAATEDRDANNAAELAKAESVANIQQKGANSRVRTTLKPDETVVGPDGEELAGGSMANSIADIVANNRVATEGENAAADLLRRTGKEDSGVDPNVRDFDFSDSEALDAMINARLGIDSKNPDSGARIEPSLKEDIAVRAAKLFQEDKTLSPDAALRQAIQELGVVKRENDGGMWGFAFEEWVREAPDTPEGGYSSTAGNAPEPAPAREWMPGDPIPPEAIEYLRANPGTRRQFEEQFKTSAAPYLSDV
jgi:hypothetical protein